MTYVPPGGGKSYAAKDLTIEGLIEKENFGALIVLERIKDVKE